MRQLLLIFHRWVALVVGILVFVVAISGSAIVFEGAMDRALNPALWHVSPTGPMLSLDTVIARAQARVPNAQVDAISVSAAPDRAHVVEAGVTQVFVNPYTGAVLGTRTAAEFNRSLPRRLHLLHVTLMGGRVGREIVGISTIMAFLLVISGVILWSPDKIWRIRWSASWKRVIFDTHHAFGAIAAIILVIITGSGLFIHYQTLNRLMYALDATPPPAGLSQPMPPTRETPAITTDAAYQAALRALPGARIMFLQLAPEPGRPFIAAMRFPEDHTPAGRSRVVIDRFTGNLLFVSSTREAQLGTRLGNSIRSIHTGDVLGKPTEAIWLLASLVLASQAITGVIMWWNARAARRAQDRRAAVASARP